MKWTEGQLLDHSGQRAVSVHVSPSAAPAFIAQTSLTAWGA